MTARADRHRTDATALTVDDRELIERLERESRTVFPERMRDGHSYHSTANALDLAADRLQSLLSDRDKLREALRRIETGECVVDWSDNPQEEMQDEARAALIQTEVP